MFRHVTESKWNLKPFFKPKLKPNFSQLNCHPADSQTDAGRHQLYNNGSLVLFPLLGSQFSAVGDDDDVFTTRKTDRG